MNNPFVSIIIPLSKKNYYIEECLEQCLKLDYPYYEIIVLPDEKFDYQNGRVKIIPTGNMGPAQKRNIGVENTKGEIIAFIDDDTYPKQDWLNNAVKNFNDPEIAAVGGPAVTPSSDTMLQKASGSVYESLMGGGTYRYRYTTGERRYVDDYPSCNFIIRKDVLTQLSGFQTNFWPGEDTALCLDLVHKLKKKIIYDPSALIYHHRRSLFKGHLKQVMAYALHRGYFVKRFPKTSLRVSYFLPSIFVLFLMFGWMMSLKFYLFSLLLYVILGISKGFLTFLGIVSTHIVYGIWFIKGLLSKRLEEECA